MRPYEFKRVDGLGSKIVHAPSERRAQIKAGEGWELVGVDWYWDSSRPGLGVISRRRW